MTKVQAEFIREALEYGAVEVSVRSDYSGRCMYGKTTHGVVVPNVLDAFGAIVAFLKTLDEENLLAVPELDDLRQDQMGLHIILY